jgi:hypothetical protein
VYCETVVLTIHIFGIILVRYTAPATEASLLPPTTDWKPLSNQTSPFQLLSGVRLSSTILKALSWAGQWAGVYHTGKNETLLDADLWLNTTFSPPNFVVPGNNNLSVGVPSGFAYAVCNSDGPDLDSPILNLTFANLFATGNLSYTNDSYPGIALQLTDVDTSRLDIQLHYPHLPLPTNIVENGMKDLINGEVDYFNRFLKYNAFFLPRSTGQFMPRPEVNLIAQHGCCNNTHGKPWAFNWS